MLSSILRRSAIFLSVGLAAAVTLAAQPPFDLVIAGGRVVNPESGLDSVRHVGIRGDRIAEISAEPLTGRDVLDAGGLVVAPGFIDIHRHAHVLSLRRARRRDQRVRARSRNR